MRKLGIAGLVTLALAVVTPADLFAGCTASLTCSNACGAALECPESYIHLTCQASNEVLSCSGNTSCTVGSNSIQCDSMTYTCQSTTNRCRKGATWVSCAGQQKNCPTCGGRVCNLSAPSWQELLENLDPLPADSVTTEAAAD